MFPLTAFRFLGQILDFRKYEIDGRRIGQYISTDRNVSSHLTEVTDMDAIGSAGSPTLSCLDRKLDEVLVLLSAMQRRMNAIEVPDETVGGAAAVRTSGLTATLLRTLVRTGVLSDARPVHQRKNGVPLRWFASELAAYREGGAEAVNLVRKARGRDKW